MTLVRNFRWYPKFNRWIKGGKPEEPPIPDREKVKKLRHIILSLKYILSKT